MVVVRDYHMVPEWCNKYSRVPYIDAGRDFEGFDCWGMMYLVQKHERGITLPKWDFLKYGEGRRPEPETAAEALRLFDNAASYGWQKIAEGAEESRRKARLFDGLLLKVAGSPVHVGVVVARGRMLHTEKKTGCGVEDFTKILWKDRVLGAYRYCPA